MRPLTASLAAVVVAVSLGGTVPAHAAGRSWHNAIKFRGAHGQVCRTSDNQMFYVRLNNSAGHHYAKLTDTETYGGQRLGGGSTPYIAPHHVGLALGGTIYHRHETIRLTVRLQSGAHHTVHRDLATIGHC